MLKGKRYRLISSTLAIDTIGSKNAAVTVPAGAEVVIADDHRPGDRMIDVLWDGRKVTMFIIDLQQRGEQI